MTPVWCISSFHGHSFKASIWKSYGILEIGRSTSGYAEKCAGRIRNSTTSGDLGEQTLSEPREAHLRPRPRKAIQACVLLSGDCQRLVAPQKSAKRDNHLDGGGEQPQFRRTRSQLSTPPTSSVRIKDTKLGAQPSFSSSDQASESAWSC